MDIEDFEVRVAEAAEPERLWHLLTSFFKGTDVERVVYHHVPPLGAPDAGQIEVEADGVDPALVDVYVREKHYRNNPMLQHALNSIEPFYFDEVSASKDLTPAQLAWLDEIHKLNLDRGLGVQVFGPNGRNGYCGLGFHDGVTRLDPQAVPTYQWACQLSHLRYCSLLLPTLGPPPQLSGRETEVLGWVARGKSNTSIGEILGISAHTVDAHLRRIYLKLGVFDRISAAVRGIGVGLIHADS